MADLIRRKGKKNEMHDESVEMPRYHCHKDVWALKIRDITDPTVPGNESDGSRLLHFEDAGYGARRVSHDFVRKHLPLVHQIGRASCRERV